MVSLDHNLGMHTINGGDGTALVEWMATRNIWPIDGIRVHTLNPLGSRNMLQIIDLQSPYSLKVGTIRGSFTLDAL